MNQHIQLNNSFQKWKARAGGVPQVVEHLPSKYEALVQTPVHTHEKKIKERARCGGTYL
jgi:hypothetical protein